MKLNALENVKVKSGLRPKVLDKKRDHDQSRSQLRNQNVASKHNPLDRLCELLLSWDIISALSSPTATNFVSINSLPSAFNDMKEYIEVWEPLIVEEIKANIISNAPSNMKSRRGGTVNLASLDVIDLNTTTIRLWCEFNLKSAVTTSIELPTTKNLKYRDDDRKDLPGVMDLLLLSSHPLPQVLNQNSIAQLPKDICYMIGIVTSNIRPDGTRGTMMKVSRPKWYDAQTQLAGKQPANTISTSTRSADAPIAKTAKAKPMVMHFLPVDSLTSSWREFLALHDIGNSSPLISEILASSTLLVDNSSKSSTEDIVVDNVSNPVSIIEVSHKTVINIPGMTPKFMDFLKLSFNSSQLKAIEISSKRDGFVLIQGPPGSGKTSTILGILNSIHLREYNRFYKHAIEAMLSEEGLQCRLSPDSSPWLKLLGKVTKHKPHILVAAPSNVAVDNIIQRIFFKGFVDGAGNKYNPSILRVGGGKSPRVKIVSLEDTLEQEASHSSSDADRTLAIDSMSSQINQAIRKLYQLQSFLINLKTAFLAHPLPAGWEVRVASDTCLPYWVDHVNKVASTTPPPAIGLSKPKVVVHSFSSSSGSIQETDAYSSIVNGDYTLDSLPEFAIHAHNMTQLLDQLDKLNTSLSRHRFRSSSYDTMSNKQAIESSIIDSAHIVFTTLNSSGHPSLEATEFCVTIVDEAAQCVEPSMLIALRRGCRRCILVGDPQQLPATIFADHIREVGYDRSLFERLTQSGHPMLMLDTQYRMLPLISRFPSHSFYEGKLKDGSNVNAENYCPKFLNPKLTKDIVLRNFGAPAASELVLQIPSFTFFNLISSRDTSVSQSRSNLEEVRFCINLVETLKIISSRVHTSLGSIGIITPYSEQLGELRRSFQKAGLVNPSSTKNNSSSSSDGCVSQSDSYLDIELNTVDGFQGQEKDIIIISTVRSNDYGNIGFLADPRRLNVAITRAKFGLFIVGNADTLSSNDNWRDLICYTQSMDNLWDIQHSNVNLIQIIERNSNESVDINTRLGIPSSVSAAALNGYNEDMNADHDSYGNIGIQLKRRKIVTSDNHSDCFESALEDGEVSN